MTIRTASLACSSWQFSIGDACWLMTYLAVAANLWQVCPPLTFAMFFWGLCAVFRYRACCQRCLERPGILLRGLLFFGSAGVEGYTSGLACLFGMITGPMTAAFVYLFVQAMLTVATWPRGEEAGSEW